MNEYWKERDMKIAEIIEIIGKAIIICGGVVLVGGAGLYFMGEIDQLVLSVCGVTAAVLSISGFLIFTISMRLKR